MVPIIKTREPRKADVRHLREPPMRILVTGASGSGTTTLGQALANELGVAFFDVDDYYWLPTKPPFQEKRDRVLRMTLLLEDLNKVEFAVLSGSVVNWGGAIEDSFSLIIFLTLPTPIRIARLRNREIEQHGSVDPNFLAWAAQYDEGGLAVRSLVLHERWLAERLCQVVRLDGDLSVEERVAHSIAAAPTIQSTGA